MQISCRVRGMASAAATKAYVKRRLGFALGRFADRIESVSVSLRDVNGPRGGEDKECTVVVDLPRRGTVTIRAVAAAIGESIDVAAGRVRRAVVRRLQRVRDVRMRPTLGEA